MTVAVKKTINIELTPSLYNQLKKLADDKSIGSMRSFCCEAISEKIIAFEKLRKEFYELNDRMVQEGKLRIDDCLTPCSQKVYFQFDGRNSGVWIGKVQLDHITVTLNMRSAKPIDVAMDCDYYNYQRTGRRSYSNNTSARYNEPIKLSKRLIYAGGLSYPDTVYCYE